MQKLEYNGWYNYETWNFKLWADNDEPIYNKIQGIIKDIKNIPLDENKDVQILAHKLRRLANEGAPELNASFYSDIMMSGMCEVNYLEIAERLLEDYELDQKAKF